MQTGAISVFGAMEIGMTLPKAIQAQIDAADALVEQMNGAPAPVETPAEPVEPSVAQQPPEVHVPQVTPAQQPQQHDEWQSRFHTLRGKYDAEVPRLSQQVRELQTAMQTLLAENERLKQAPAQAPANLVTDADREAFGTDLIDAMDRVAKQATSPVLQEVERLRQEKAQLEERLGSVNKEVAVSAQDRYQTKLTQLVPNWETVNQDQGFLVWLGQTDPVFGVARQAALDAAYGRLDAPATAAVFQAYLATTTPAAPVTAARQELQSQVAPSRSRVAAAPAADDGANKIWTDRDIQQFYTDVRKGAYTQAEADRIEDQINRAVAEGRFRA